MKLKTWSYFLLFKVYILSLLLGGFLKVDTLHSFSFSLPASSGLNQDPKKPNSFSLTVPVVAPKASIKKPSFTLAIPAATPESGDFFKKITEINSQTFGLSVSISNLLATYKQSQSSTINHSFSFSIPAVVSNVPVQNTTQVLQNTAVSSLEKTTFSSLQELLSGAAGASYSSLLNALWAAYAKRIQDVAATDKAQSLQIAQAPFIEGSTLLSVYTQVVAEILNFLKIKIGTFSSVNFASAEAVYFLQTEVPALDAIVNQMQTVFDSHFNGTSGDGYPSVAKNAGTLAQSLQSNYNNIKTAYFKQKTDLFLQFTTNLFQALFTSYSPTLALSGSETKVMKNPFLSTTVTQIFSCLQQYYAYAAFNAQATISIGTYQTQQAVVQALNGWLGSLYVYAALIGKNNSEQSAAGLAGQSYQNGNSTTDAFIVEQQVLISQTESFYQNAAQCFTKQLDLVQSFAYLQISSLLKEGLFQWKKAESLLGKNSFLQAIQAYQLAAQLFKKTGMVNLASVLKQRAATITLLYYQVLLKTYLQYYQTQIAQSITTMSTPPASTVTAQQTSNWHTAYPGGFLQLFYYDPGSTVVSGVPVFQGIGWLCTQALPACLSMLNSFQLDTSTQAKQVQTYLYQSMSVLSGIINGSQSMFYNDVLTGSDKMLSHQQQAANANIGSLTVKGAVEGFLQYFSIYGSFVKADQMLQSSTTTTFQSPLISDLPFAGLFQGTALSGFSDLSLLSQIYWTILNIDPCLSTAIQYPAFKNTLISAALVLATYAQALSLDVSLKSVLNQSFFTYLQQKMTAVAGQVVGGQTAVDLVMQEGQSFLQNPSSSLDYQSALACFMAAGLQKNAAAQNSYFSTIDAYAQWSLKNKEVSICPAFQSAIIYYSGYLATQLGWKSSYDVATMIKTNLTQGVQELTEVVGHIQTALSSQDFNQALALTQQLSVIQKMIETMLIGQKREQLLLAKGQDLFSVVKGTSKAGRPTFQYSSAFIPTVQFPVVIDTDYMLAEIYYQQAQQQLKTMQQNFSLTSYVGSNTSWQESYNQLNSLFSQATDYFSKSGYFDMVTKVQQAVTQAAAFFYFSLVIPSDSVTNRLKKSLQSTPSFTQVFEQNQQKELSQPPSKKTFSLQINSPSGALSSQKNNSFSIVFHTNQAADLSNQTNQVSSLTNIVNPTISLSTGFEKPDYLLRYNEKDLTLLAQQEAEFKIADQAVKAKIKTASEQLAKSSNTSLPVVSSGLTYAQLLAQAQNFLGKQKSVSTTSSDTSLVTKLIVPLYERFLIDNNFSSPFITLSQEVQRYAQQVTQLVTAGMEISGTTIMTSYSLQSRMIGESEHIILVTHYGPLQAIPRFSGELETALFYYTQYAQFFSQNPTTIQVAGTVYNQIPDPNNTQTAQAFKNIIGTYLSQYSFYQNVVNSVVQQSPQAMSIEQTKQANFEPYASLYALLSNAYSWIFSSLNSIQQIQQNKGIFWMPINTIMTMQLQQYKQFMHNRARFLVGYPLSSSYKQVLKDIDSLAYMAIQSTQSSSDQVAIFQALGDCYAQAGKVTATYAEPIPGVGGYPRSAPTSLPLEALNFSAAYTGCQLPQSTPEQMPQNFTLSWKNYYGGSEFYSQAFNKYEQAYQINNPGGLNAVQNDQKSCTAWGQSLYFIMKAITQRISLFGKNAFVATITPADDGSSEIKMNVSEQFKSIVQQGQSNGSLQAQQEFAGLQGGAMASSNNNQYAQSQYLVMKKMILEALIYCSSAQIQTDNLVKTTQSVGTINEQDNFSGQIIKCAVGYYLPGLQMLAAQQQNVGDAYQAGNVGKNKTEDVEVETPIIALPAQEVSLSALSQSDVQQLVYSNTFPAFVDYCLSSLMGSFSSSQPFNLLSNANSTAALNDFVSQMYTVLQSLYSWIFLPPSDQNNPEQLGIDISAAIKAQEQAMIVNPESYVG